MLETKSKTSLTASKQKLTYMFVQIRVDVRVIQMIPLNGLNLNTVESAVHALFGKVRLNVGVTGNDGKLHKAKEWFNLPLEAINDVVTLIQDNTIHLYRYDAEQQKLIKR